ncbi:MAG: T9SS type A sorting domain-containing protein [Bacteroidia bacterium]
MKTKIIYIFITHLLIGFAHFSLAQTVKYSWGKQIYGNGGEFLHAFSVNSNILIGGDFTEEIAFSSSLKFVKQGPSNYNGYFASFTLDGTLNWARQIVGSSYVDDIAEGEDKSVLSVGAFFTPLTFGSIFLPANEFGIFFVKYDSVGNLVWLKASYGDPIFCNNIEVTPNGDYVIGGGFFNQALLDSTLYISEKGGSPFVIKYSPNGEIKWIHRDECTGSSARVIGMKVDNFGNIYTCGSFYDTLFSVNDTFTTTSFGQNMYIGKYDSLGNELWMKTIKGDASIFPNELQLDNLGNIIIVGAFNDGGATSSIAKIFLPTDTLISHGHEDMFIIKLDSEGNYIWGNSWGGQGTEGFASVDTDSKGNIYASGYTNSNFSIGNIYINNISQDHFLTCLNTAGEIQWVQVQHSSSNNGDIRPVGVSVDQYDNIYASGIFHKHLSVPLIRSNTQFNSFDDYNIFIEKIGIRIQHVQVNCEQGYPYSINTTALGGNLPIQYSVDGGITFQTQPVTQNLVPGIYPISITNGVDTLHGDTVTLYPKVVLPQDTSIYQTDSILLIAPEGYNYYLWNDSIEADQYLFDAATLEPADYFVKLLAIDRNGCLTEDSIKIHVNFPLKLFKAIENTNIRIYPNPAYSEFFLESNDTFINVNIEIVDIHGKKLIQKKLNHLIKNSPESFDLSTYSKGIFLIKIQIGDKLSTYKVLKL